MNNDIIISLKNSLGLISKIHTIDDCKSADDKRVLSLLNAILFFIKEYPDVFNEKQNIYGISNVLNENLKNIMNGKDIIEEHFNFDNIVNTQSNPNNISLFDDLYYRFEDYNIKSTGENKKIEVYYSAISKMEFFLYCIGETNVIK